MKSKKLILIGFVCLIITVFATPSHASGGVFGNIGIYDYPWNISIGYNDYGHRYRKPHYVEHHHYYHKPKHYRHKKHYHHRHHGHYKHYKRYNDRGHYSHYRPHHDYEHRYCNH